MSLFPPVPPAFYDPKDHEILQRMSHFYAEALTFNQSFWGEADTDTRFESGDQSLWNDLYSNIPTARRRQFNFNRIRRVVQLVSGWQRRNRKSTIVNPVENGDQDTADQFSKILMWVAQQEGVLETVSEAFHGSLVTGMNLLHVWTDFRSDPVNGNIKVDNCAYNSFLMDPFFRKTDLSDCNAIWKRSFLTRRECISLLPADKDLIMAMSGQDTRDGKFNFMPESYAYDMKKLLTYDEFYYKTFRTQKMLVDTRSGDTMEWKSSDDDGLRAFLGTYPTVTMIEQEVPTVNLAIVVHGKVMYDGPNPMGIDRYPFVPVLAYYNPQMPYFPWRIQGIVRGLRDSQYLFNRTKILQLDILESQVNSGFFYKENALVNPKDVFLSGQGKGIALKESPMPISELIQKIEPAQVPASITQLSEMLGKEIQEISGVNEAMMGSAVDEKAGILEMLRQGAGLTMLQSLFDQLDFSQKLLGKLMLDIIQTNFTPGKVKKILEGEEPSQQFYNKAFGKYDAVVEEGLNTTTQKQMQLAQMLQLKAAGVPIPNSVLVDACTIQNKKKVLEAIEQAEQQAAQISQQQAQADIQEAMARTELAKARAVADQGLGMERLSRVETNRSMSVERVSAAKRDEDAALLNLVRAIKELDGMDIEHVTGLITLAHQIEVHENPDLHTPTPAAPKVAAKPAKKPAKKTPRSSKG